MRLISLSYFSVVSNHLVDYPSPSNISYYWGFGSLAGIFLGIQLITGIFLAMHYVTHVSLAFNSVEHIMRDVNSGWFIRYLHSNGASLFFMVVYTHIGRGLYFGSFWRGTIGVWYTGVLIFFLMMATAFIGYVLPWGQMSFWGATVITNLFTAIPIVGNYIVYWLWGGFSVANPTLNRFFSLHYLLPFVIAGLVIVHLTLLHLTGSTNPLGILKAYDRRGMYPYFYVKDLFGLFIVFIFFLGLVSFYPDLLSHSDNYIEANPLVTPSHIVPEWYFLPFYAILRSVPNKLGGVILMLAAILFLLVLPLFTKPSVRSLKFRPISQVLLWSFITIVLILLYMGMQPVEVSYVVTSQIATSGYFLWFFSVPVVNKLESWLCLINR